MLTILATMEKSFVQYMPSPFGVVFISCLVTIYLVNIYFRIFLVV